MRATYPFGVVEEKKRRKKSKRTPGTTGRVTTPTPRYTPPVPVRLKHSSRWVPILMFGFFALGVLTIILNYLPGAPGVGELGHLFGLSKDGGNAYLLIGLVFICLGFGAATRYR